MARWLMLAVVLLQDPATPKFELKVRPVEGDKLETLDTWTHTFRGKIGEEPLATSSRGGRRLVVEMGKVENGRLSRKAVQVVDAYVEQQDMQTGKYVRKDDPIHGRKATIVFRGGKEEREGLDGVPEAWQKQLTLADPLARLFPDAPVRVGESWEFAGDGVKKIYVDGDFTEGRIVVTLRDVKEVGGRKCALLATSHDVKGKGADGILRELRLTGTMTVWIDRGYVLAMSQSGRLKSSGADAASAQPNGEAAITGELTATILEK